MELPKAICNDQSHSSISMSQLLITNNIETLSVAAGHIGLGGFPATCRQPVSLPGEEEGRYQDVCSPLLQGVADLERRRRKDKVPLRSKVRLKSDHIIYLERWFMLNLCWCKALRNSLMSRLRSLNFPVRKQDVRMGHYRNKIIWFLGGKHLKWPSLLCCHSHHLLQIL